MANPVPRPGGASPLRAQIGAATAARLDADPRARRVPVDTAQIYKVADFLDAATCDRLIALIEERRRPSTVLGDRGGAGFRTSESCDMDRASEPAHSIDARIADLLGIDAARGETMQGQRYAPGQHFRAHFDYFHEAEDYWPRMKASGGQRTWTAMIYLDDVAEGGATWFPQAGTRVAPRRGLLLAWNNMAPDGAPNPATLHEGMPVVDGVKHIVTKWFREEDWVAAG